MKRSIFALALLASFTVAAQPSNLSVLKKSFNEMQPLSIKDSNGVITVVLDAASITPEIYDTAVYSVCSPAWLHKENTAYLKTLHLFEFSINLVLWVMCLRSQKQLVIRPEKNKKNSLKSQFCRTRMLLQ